MYTIFERLLKERGLTVADVCRATGIRQSTMSNWKARNNQLSAKNASLVADFFGVSVDYLMGRTDTQLALEDALKKQYSVRVDVDADYYKDEIIAKLAQEMYNDPDMRSLFHIKRNIDARQFRAYMDLIKTQYKLEHPEEE